MMIIDDFGLVHLAILILSATCLSFGFILFSRNDLWKDTQCRSDDRSISVIIPARNEEINLPFLLGSLADQTIRPDEIIVVDDFSEDRTAEIASEYGATLVTNPPLPEGWTGKNWAVWNGYLRSTGDILIFLDSDVRLANDGIELLLASRKRTGGVISVLPYHYSEKFYERLSLILYLLGVFAFTAPAEKKKKEKSLYGSCIVVARRDYESVSGHKYIKTEILDDMSLGMSFCRSGISVENFTGGRTVSFRMYPGGLRSEFEGFSKGAVLGAATLRLPSILMIACWVVGLLISGFAFPVSMILSLAFSSAQPEIVFVLGIVYFLYSAQFYYLTAYTGRYGWLMPLLHPLASLFFMIVMVYSVFRTTFYKNVLWKGRIVSVSENKSDRSE